MASISTASSEQSSGIGQINAAIAEMDSVTQQNATKVQSIAASADNLALEAFELANVVDAFRLEGAQAESISSAREKLARAQRAVKQEMTGLPSGKPSQISTSQKRQRDASEEWETF
jgi:aerotaxis receptor